MDPLSVAASVAGVAAMGAQLSQSIYALVTTLDETEREMSTIANDLSLLAMVLSDLEGVLRQDSRVYRPRMVIVVNEILENCQDIFQGISEYIPIVPQDLGSSKRFQSRIRFYFQRHRVRPLHARLETMKSTLHVVLNVVHLARVTEGAKYFIPNTGPMFTYADVQKGRNALVTVVLENRRSIQGLKQIEEDGDRGQSLRHTIKDRQDPEVIHEELLRDDRASTENSPTVLTGRRSRLSNSSSKDKKGKRKKDAKSRKQKESGDIQRRTHDMSFDPDMPARSSSHSRYVVFSEPNSKSRRISPSSESPKPASTVGAYELAGPSASHEGSVTPSSASETYEMPPEFPVADDNESSHSKDETTTKSGRPGTTESAQRPATNRTESSVSPPGTVIVAPTAQWFLSVVPHESSVTALIVRSRSGQEDHLRARAEKTAKILLLKWTNVDPDSISESDAGGWSQVDIFDSYESRPGRDGQITNQQYRTSYAHQPYPTYAPQTWYQPPVYTLSPFTAMVTTPPAPIDEKEKEKEDLARLKKLIQEEKAEQDIRAAAAPASPPPPVPSPPPAPADPFTSIRTEKLQEDEMQREDKNLEIVGSLQTPQDSYTQRRAGHPILQPVTMKDWLRRSFIFPVIMCQTWEGLHNLIQGAFDHDLEHRLMIEKGKYRVSNEAGQYILPSTWEHFVQPGMVINMELVPYDADQYESGGKTTVGGGTEESNPESPIPPPAPSVASPQNPRILQSKSDGDRSLDGATDDDDDAETSGSDVISYVERSDPRYLSIERVLLEQKRAQVRTERKLDGNRRFFQIKQQLVEQGAAIQAREDAAEHVEQDSKLAWLEKRVRDQKEELDQLSPLLMTSPSSSAGLSLDKGTSRTPRKVSLGARLLGRKPSRSSRSKDSVQNANMITEG